MPDRSPVSQATIRRMLKAWQEKHDPPPSLSRGSIPCPDLPVRPVILTDEGDPVCWSYPVPHPDWWYGDGGIDDAERLVEWCRYRCSICGVSHPGITLVMDHDHATGWCRGVLCQYCNTVEGRGGGKLFAKYRERPPAVICGIKIRYSDFAWSIPKIAPGTWELRAWQWEPGPAYFWPLRDGKPWKKEELLLAARHDLTDEQLARILLRSTHAVAIRRKSVLGLEYAVIVERARKARAARRRRQIDKQRRKAAA